VFSNDDPNEEFPSDIELKFSILGNEKFLREFFKEEDTRFIPIRSFESTRIELKEQERSNEQEPLLMSRAA